MDYLSPAPHGASIFCDDIRFEADGKWSAIGIYPQGVMIVQTGYPRRVIKSQNNYALFGAPDQVLERDVPIDLKVFLPGEKITPVFSTVISPPHKDIAKRAINAFGVPADTDGPLFVRYSCPILIQNVLIQKSGTIRVVAEYGANKVTCGSTRVLLNEEFQAIQAAIAQPEGAIRT